MEFHIDAETISSDGVACGCQRTGLREPMLTGPTIRGVHVRETENGSVVEHDANPKEEIHWLGLRTLFVDHHGGGRGELVPFPVDVEAAAIPFSHCG